MGSVDAYAEVLRRRRCSSSVLHSKGSGGQVLFFDGEVGVNKGVLGERNGTQNPNDEVTQLVRSRAVERK
jgi:hypothetical protein